MRTFNVVAIFFRVIPTYGVLPYAMIIVLNLCQNWSGKEGVGAYNKGRVYRIG